MTYKRVLSRGISELYSLKTLVSNILPENRVLMYHAVGGQVIRDNLNIFSIKKDLFSKQMEYLAVQSDVSVMEFSVKMLSPRENSIAITFDDGYKDNLYVAAPILEKLNLPYTVFVSTDFIKCSDNNFLSPEELRRLSELPGATIGSHGMSHKPFVECSDGQLRRELVDSKSYIEDIVGKPVTTIGYPNGSVDPRVELFVSEAGYQFGGTSYMDKNFSNSNKLLLSRTCILGIDNMRVFKQKIKNITNN